MLRAHRIAVGTTEVHPAQDKLELTTQSTRFKMVEKVSNLCSRAIFIDMAAEVANFSTSSKLTRTRLALAIAKVKC